MKNFSTIGARLVIAAFLSSVTLAAAQAATCEFLPNAPDQHVVLEGDTLWDISGRFLAHPWCWGQVWGMNRDQIRNPHWIYPGQIVYFDRTAGRLRLWPGSGSGAGEPTFVRLSPQLRTQGLGKDAVPSIPSAAIEPYLSQPLIVEADELSGAPRIVATQEQHVFLGKGDKAYVRGALKTDTRFQVFRPGKPLKDPVSQKVLGYEAFYLGTVALRAAAKPGSDVFTFVVDSAKEEMGVGDQLLPVPSTTARNYVPHAPDGQVDARVIAIYGGVTHAGQNQVVSVNRGALDGLDNGSVLQLYHYGSTVTDTTESEGWFGKKQTQLKLPDELSGSLFIFRVFKHISYGLIMQITEPVQVGDIATSPE